MLIGIGGDILGFLIYAVAFMLLNDVSFRFFYQELFLKTDLFKAQIFTGSILLNIVLFYIFMRKRRDDINRGLIVVILFTVIAIVYYYE